MTYKSGYDLIAEAKKRIREVSAEEVKGMVARKDGTIMLDVREPNEWNLGHLPGAVHLPRGNLETRVEALIPRDTPVVVYCARGNRSALAADTMREMGYENVASMAGGWFAWMEVDGPVEG